MLPGTAAAQQAGVPSDPIAARSGSAGETGAAKLWSSGDELPAIFKEH
jgi:hypothetical protein